MNTMQNWADNAQIRVPGYRDRVVHISLNEGEGGLNLNMPASRIDSLSTRGSHAGVMLVERFAKPASEAGELSWDNHRWVRYRSLMALLEQVLVKFGQRYAHAQPGESSYADLVRRQRDQPPNSYRWRNADHQSFCSDASDALVALAEPWQQEQHTFQDGAPKPTPDLRIVLRV